MERLTTNKGQCVACIGCIEEWNCTAECDVIDHCLEKLAEYETAEEEGRLVALPCKVGSTVYLICHRYTKCSKYGETFDEYDCSGCEEWECDSHKEYYIHVNQSVSLEWIVRNMQFETFGKTVFLSRKEAEKALEEINQNNAAN